MTIYVKDDVLVVNTAYTKKSLPFLLSRRLKKQTLSSLSMLDCDPVTVTRVGVTGNNTPFIKVLTSNAASPAYRGGNGITLYFDSSTQIDNSFEYSKAFIKDKCVFKVLNITGSTIAKNSLVYQNGFDPAQQLPTIALASAAATSTSIVLGITADEIENNGCGSVVSEGSVILDTSSFSSEGDAVYLGDTPGAISTTAGTETTIVGRILCVGNPGSLSIFSTLTGGANTGGGGATNIFDEVILDVANTDIRLYRAAASVLAVDNNSSGPAQLSVAGSGTNSEQFGLGSTALADNSVAVGNGASIDATSMGSVAIGRSSTIQDVANATVINGSLINSGSGSIGNSVVINTTINNMGAADLQNIIAIKGTTLSQNTICLGGDIDDSSANSIVIGVSSNSMTGGGSVVIGTSASSNAANNVVIGTSAGSTDTQNNVMIGSGATAPMPSDTWMVCIGAQTVGGNRSICIGTGASAMDSADAICLGATANTMRQGAGMAENNVMVIGSGNSQINTIYFGGGIEQQGSPTTYTLSSSEAQLDNIPDTSGCSLALQSGRGTGSATASTITFKTPTPATSGMSAQVLTTRLTIDDTTSTFTIPVVVPSYTVAGAPATATAGGVIFVTDETGGAVLAFGDGTNWRRVTDRAIIS